MAFIKEGEENIEPVKPFWQMSKEELKAILNNFVGNFEKQLNSKRKHEYLKNPPTCGMPWLRDRGVLLWYLESGWISVSRDGFVKDANGKDTDRIRWAWAVTMKYVEEGIPKFESALEELMGRREFAKKKKEEEDEIVINQYKKEVYELAAS